MISYFLILPFRARVDIAFIVIILTFCHIFNVAVMSNDLTTKIDVDVAADVKHSMYLLI